MNKQTLPYYYFATAGVNLFANATDSEVIELVSKPLLLPLLALWFWRELSRTQDSDQVGMFKGSSSNGEYVGLKGWMMAAFCLSWAGDVLLIFVGRPPLYETFFLLGLGTFLLAHVSYIVAFLRIKKWVYDSGDRGRADQDGGGRGRANNAANFSEVDTTGAHRHVESRFRKEWIVFAAMLVGLLGILYPGMDAPMKLPVTLYGIVIILMSLTALELHGKINEASFRVLFSGTLFFIVSDSLLAINKFRWEIPFSGIAIMATYLAAQYLIALGVLRVLGSPTLSSD